MMKKIVVSLFCAFALVGNVLSVITVTNKAIYPVYLWIPDPRIMDCENPVTDPLRLEIPSGKTICFEPFIEIPFLYINVKFDPRGMQKSCYSDSRFLTEDGKAYEIFIVDIEDNALIYNDVMGIAYDQWKAIMRVQG